MPSFNPFAAADSSGRRSKREPFVSREPRSPQPQLPSTASFRPAAATQPIPIPESRARKLSFGGTKKMQPPASFRRSFIAYDDGSDPDDPADDAAAATTFGPGGGADDGLFPMESDSRPGSRLSTSAGSSATRSASRSRDGQGLTLPPVNSPFSRSKPRSTFPADPQLSTSSSTQGRPARQRRDSFTSANPSLDLDLEPMSSALPTYQPRPAASPYQDHFGSQPFGLSGSTSGRGRSYSSAAPPSPVSSKGAARVEGFDLHRQPSPQPGGKSFPPQNSASRQQQQQQQRMAMDYDFSHPNSAHYSSIKRKKSPVFYIDPTPQTYSSSSSYGSSTPRNSFSQF